MRILGIDTSETVCAVALFDGEKLKSSCIKAGMTHSERLLPAINGLLERSNLNYNDIDVFAVSIGPGSFTGIRIGVATVKGLAFGRNITCIGVSALEAMAYNFVGKKGIICPCMDARRGQIYNALFECDGNSVRRLTEDRQILAEDLAEEMKNYDNIYFCGGGYEIITLAAKRKGVKFNETPDELRDESGVGVIFAAMNKYDRNGNFTDTELAPVYLRPSQAERMRNGEKEE